MTNAASGCSRGDGDRRPEELDSNYDLAVRDVNSVVPFAYIIIIATLTLSVDGPALLLCISILFLIGNIALGAFIGRAPPSQTGSSHRLEFGRFLLNTTAAAILISLYADQTAVWLLIVPDALLMGAVWRGRRSKVVYLVQISVCLAAFWSAGLLPSMQAGLFVGTYLLCASVTGLQMGRVRTLLDERREAAERVRLFEQEAYLQQAALQRRAMLSSASQLSASLAHEVNNPLFAALGNLEYIVESGFPDDLDPAQVEELRAAMTDSQAALQTIRGIVKQMARFSQARAHQTELLSDLTQVMEDCKKLLVNGMNPGVELIVEVDEIPRIRATRVGIIQIVTNLVMNGNHAMESQGGGEIRVRVGTGNHGRALIEVSDTGCGIAPQDIDRLFLPFFTTRPGEGSGLGLALVHELVDELGGRIDVESEVGAGSTFSIRLPPVDESVEDTDRLQFSPASPSPLDHQRRSILVVEDDQNLARMLTRALSEHHDITHATDAASAMRMIEAGGSFEAVLCDVVMPGMSGVELFEQIREDHPELVNSWVFMTGGAVSPDDRRFLEDGATPLVQKPIETDELLRILNTLWSPSERQGQQGSVRSPPPQVATSSQPGPSAPTMTNA